MAICLGAICLDEPVNMPMAKTVGYHRFVVVGGLAVLGSRPAEHLPSRIGKNIGKLRQTDNEGEVPNST